MDISDEDFSDEFSIFGISLDNDDVFTKLKTLCHLHRLDASDIVAQWVAFAHSNKGCKLNPDTLDQLERDRLAPKKGSKPSAKSANPKSNSSLQKIKSLDEGAEGDGDLLDAYSTPQSKAKKRQHTPDQAVNKRIAGVGRSPATPFSPASFSPAASATPSRKYSSRSNAGDGVLTYGAAVSKWRSGRNEPVAVATFDPTSALTAGFKYMFQKLTDKACVLSDQLDELGEALMKQHNIEEVGHIAMPSQEEMTVIGRVCCDSNGKLNAKSVLLEGSRGTSGGRQIPVELGSLTQYSLFPGQVVAMKGINSSGTKFVAKSIMEGCTPNLPEKAPQLNGSYQRPSANYVHRWSRDQWHEWTARFKQATTSAFLPTDLYTVYARSCLSEDQGRLSVLVAAGPFTTTDSIMYEPLADLVKALLRDQPDVAVLMGPFVDSKNPEIEKSIVDVTYEEFFKTNIVEPIVNATERLSTQLVFVPSSRDVHHTPVYPQPPFKVNDFKNNRVHFVSDPCTLSIDGVVFGITSTDVLFHLGAEEISSGATTDRLARLCQHLLTQKSYYPLLPPSEEVNMDMDHMDVYGRMSVTPHVMLIPSDLRYFVKDVGGCCCVNPGRLAKGQVGGTFARLVIPPIPNARSLASTISAQVIRV